MTDPRIRRLVETTTTAQGVPVHLEDPATLVRVAALVDQTATVRTTPKATAAKAA